MPSPDTLDSHPAYLEWLQSQGQRKGSKSALNALELQLKQAVRDELARSKSMDATEYMLWHKYQEVQEWLPSQSISHINWVKRNIWKPKGRSDFRRIQPELIYVRDEYHLKSKNIWGEASSILIQNKEPHARHWEIMRTLISSGRNDGTIGRALRFIVRDKPTKTYLGVICIGSAMAMLKPRNDAIGWKNQDEFFYQGSRLDNIANGQSIVPTQPFGSAYLGGKLLSLLCLSDVVADRWKKEYDNLNPYWDSKMGDTLGQTPLKPSDELYFRMRDWMQVTHPEDFYRHFVEKRPGGQLRMRDNKSRAILFCYKKLGLDKSNYLSDHKRGVYRSRLYTNTDAFLRSEINEDQLVPAFDNSVEALTEFWKFGTMGDTRMLDADAKAKLKNDPKKIANKIRMKGMVKGQVDARDPARHIPTQGNQVDWYQDLGSMSWQEAKEKYSSEVGR
jgi:hypothetical protein